MEKESVGGACPVPRPEAFAENGTSANKEATEKQTMPFLEELEWGMEARKRMQEEQ